MLHIWRFPSVMRKTRPAARARIRSFVPRLETLEDRTLLATLVVSPGGTVPGSFSSIQAAVNAAAPSGDTILVDPGTYTEQVTIGKSLTLEGNGAGAIIQSPTTLTPDALGVNVLVEVNSGATVNINNLTVEGLGAQSSPTVNNLFGVGVFGGATANLTGDTINNVNLGLGSSSFALQAGIGILVGSGGPVSGQVGHATITDCTITNYQKGGIVIGNGSSGTITGNTITGVGPNTQIAQNGIQASPGAGSVTISDNTVSGNEYTGTLSGPNPVGGTTQADGILNFGSSTIITGNTLSGNDNGIENLSFGSTTAAATISGNTVQDNRFQGILLEQGTATVSNNTITGNNIGVAFAAFPGDTTNAVGTLISNNITNNGNVPVGFSGGGIVVLSATGATTTPQVTANFNRIVGNSVGLNNTTAATVDAINNWWGSNAGPGGAGSDTVSGSSVNFNPWLVLLVTASPTSLLPGAVATVVASLTTNSSGVDTSTLGHVPNGIPVAFTATGGTIAPTTAVTADGKAVAQFTAGSSPGTATVSATVDNQTSTATFTVTSPPPSLPGESLLGQLMEFTALNPGQTLNLQQLITQSNQLYGLGNLLILLDNNPSLRLLDGLFATSFTLTELWLDAYNNLVNAAGLEILAKPPLLPFPSPASP